jgi:hypothetical protein
MKLRLPIDFSLHLVKHRLLVEILLIHKGVRMKMILALMLLVSSHAFAGRGATTDCSLSKITQRATSVAQAFADSYYGNKNYKVEKTQHDTSSIYDGNQKVYEYLFEAGELLVSVAATSYRSSPGSQCYITKSQISVKPF